MPGDFLPSKNVGTGVNDLKTSAQNTLPRLQPRHSARLNQGRMSWKVGRRVEVPVIVLSMRQSAACPVETRATVWPGTDAACQNPRTVFFPPSSLGVAKERGHSPTEPENEMPRFNVTVRYEQERGIGVWARDEQEAEEKALDIVEDWNGVLRAEARDVEEE